MTTITHYNDITTAAEAELAAIFEYRAPELAADPETITKISDPKNGALALLGRATTLLECAPGFNDNPEACRLAWEARLAVSQVQRELTAFRIAAQFDPYAQFRIVWGVLEPTPTEVVLRATDEQQVVRLLGNAAGRLAELAARLGGSPRLAQSYGTAAHVLRLWIGEHYAAGGRPAF